MAFDRDRNYIGKLDINSAYRYAFVGNCGITQDRLYRDGKVSIIDAAWIQRYSVYMKSADGIGEPVRDL